MKLPIFFLISLITFSSSAFYYQDIGVDYDETIPYQVEKVENELPILPVSCRSREKGLWDLCFSIIKEADENGQRTLKPRSLKLHNYGNNSTFPPSGFLIGRDFEFLFEDFASADLSLLIWDVPSEKDSDGHMMLMTILPRTQIPAIKYIGENQTEVTLANNEKVIFNSLTNEILDGVLKEGKLQLDEFGRAARPDIKYTGAGIAIVASRIGNYPVGDEFSSQSKKLARNLADIYYQQKIVCQIPVKEIWFTNYNNGGQVSIKSEFAQDSALISYIEKKCKIKIQL